MPILTKVKTMEKLTATPNPITKTPLKNVIQETSDYKIFKRLKGNRDVNQGMVADLVESFQEKPQLRLARPVLLNDKYEVIDGQHRLEASVKMHLPVYYMVVDDLTVDDARLLNALQRSWSMMDYAKSYADSGNHEYERFLELQREYQLSPSAVLRYCTAGRGTDSEKDRTAFRYGKFFIDDEATTIEWLNKLRGFSKFVPFWANTSFGLAVFRLLKTNSYDHERMMRKLDEGNALVVRGASYDFLRDLEIIYNRGASPNQTVRFI